MEVIVTKLEAIEIIERIPYILTVQAPNIKIRKEFYDELMIKNSPLEWIKIIKSVYIRKNDGKLFPDEDDYYNKAKFLLQTELSKALDMPYSDIEDYIVQYLKDTL